ncbi:hypothetical protein KVV02_005084 [Mortierella alpina]|uniref:Uncharacterized protein n=1 Tax=Mortierella alpina TaxID=64518 RepID=A0A9P7ZZW5_MORAP|nr:hypothetical protein KVV02_005084 [Mortierella alpina]
MTDPDFEDAADFDVKDISNILKDIDSANLALDALDGRAEKLTASLASLLRAQSGPNPFANNVESDPVEEEDETRDVDPTSATEDEFRTPPISTRAPPPSAVSMHHSMVNGAEAQE